MKAFFQQLEKCEKVSKLFTELLSELYKIYQQHGELVPVLMTKNLLTKYGLCKTYGRSKNCDEWVEIETVMPKYPLTKRIISAKFKPSSYDTVEIFMDEGWQFSFRIHNASSKVETSLKFDVQIIGMPISFVCYDYNWE